MPTRLLETPRLLLRRPTLADAAGIFASYAADAEVTHWLAWPRHRSIDDTHAYLTFSDTEWSHWPVGPLLMIAKADGAIVGTTGLDFETPYRASTGYVLAKQFWGQGYAVEALHLISTVAMELDVQRLYALCHTDHLRSRRVLEKAGFANEGILRRYMVFPNSGIAGAQDVYCYAKVPLSKQVSES